jgi:hypothetical protein
MQPFCKAVLFLIEKLIDSPYFWQLLDKLISHSTNI